MSWETRALRHVAAITVSSVDKKTIDGETPVRLVNYTDVYYGNRLTPDLDLMPATASPSQVAAFHLKPGDVVITKDSETADDIGIAAYVERTAPDMVCGYHLAILRPLHERVDGRYLYWTVGADPALGQFSTGATGVTRYGLRTEAIAATQIAVPPLSTQRAIADYLDTETARIDALIEKKKRMVELLEEQRFAEIRRAMEECGHETVGLRHICRVKRGQSPRPIDDPKYFDDFGSHGWVRIEDVSRSGMYLCETRERLSDLGRSRSVPVGPGVVLVSIAATVGKPVITDMDCCYHDGFVGLHDLRALPEFVYFCLVLPEAFGGLGNLGTQTNINSEIVGRVRVPRCDVSLQSSVVEKIRVKLGEVESLVGHHRTQLDLLTEKRQALITAAVTGELDIPGVAA